MKNTFKQIWNNKTQVNFDNINKSLFEELRDLEVIKEAKIIEWFFESIRSLKLLIEDSSSPHNYFNSVSGKLDRDTMRKVDRLYTRYCERLLNEIEIQLVKDDEELLNEGFFDKFEHLK